MREILDAVARGELSPAAAEAELQGYATTEAGRFDAARETRRGVPEAILAEDKTEGEVATLTAAAVETSGRAIVTRLEEGAVAAVRDALPADAEVERDGRARTLIAHAPEFDPPSVDAAVGIVTGGTADAAVAGEAAAIAREMGADVELIADVGVASLVRIVDELDALRAADVLIVAAGREGALPTVVAGLVDVPVIGLPVPTGYGVAGSGEAALYGMLQSCTVLSTVNVGAGFVAGAQAGLIARAVGAARSAESDPDSRDRTDDGHRSEDPADGDGAREGGA